MLKKQSLLSCRFFISIIFIQILIFLPFTHAEDHQWNGENYSKNKSIQFQGAIDQLNQFKFEGTEDVLDIGSGDGEITSIISKKTKGKTVGLDIDRSMVSFSNSRFKNDRLNFIYGNGSEISYKDQFHLITAFNSAQWIENQIEFLQRVNTALKPDGKILFGLPTIIADEPIGTSLMVSIFKEVTHSEKWNIYFKEFKSPWNFFTEQEYLSMLKQAHFKEIQIAITKKPFKLPNVTSFINWMKQISPHLKYIPEDRKDEFLNEIASRYLAKVPLNEKGEVLLSHAQLEVSARTER